jgi:hypothetical protein
MTTTPDTPPPTLPASLLARLDEYHDAVAVCARKGGWSDDWAKVWDARSSLLRELGEYVADRERLQLAEMVLGNFRQAHCLRALLGEDSDGCECMGCASRAYFAAARTPSPQARDTDG